jgi:hypothetical protein
MLLMYLWRAETNNLIDQRRDGGARRSAGYDWEAEPRANPVVRTT